LLDPGKTPGDDRIEGCSGCEPTWPTHRRQHPDCLSRSLDRVKRNDRFLLNQICVQRLVMAVVVDPHGDGLVVGAVLHLDLGAERQGLVRGGELVGDA
jgi:hypothetical protein